VFISDLAAERQRPLVEHPRLLQPAMVFIEVGEAVQGAALAALIPGLALQRQGALIETPRLLQLAQPAVQIGEDVQGAALAARISGLALQRQRPEAELPRLLQATPLQGDPTELKQAAGLRAPHPK